MQKAQRVVDAYHRFRELAQALLEINEKICQARPLQPELDLAKKKRRKSSSRSRQRSRTSVATSFPHRREAAASGSGSGGDRGSFCNASGWSRCADSVATV